MAHEDVCMIPQHTCVCMTVQLTVGFIIKLREPTLDVLISLVFLVEVWFEKVTLPPDGP